MERSNGELLVPRRLKQQAGHLALAQSAGVNRPLVAVREGLASEQCARNRCLWRIAFEWEDGDALHIDLEQYHRGAGHSAKQSLKMEPIHPGAILRLDVLPALNLIVSEAARQLGVSRQMLHSILAERSAVSPAMAVRLGRFCGNGAGFWLRMQTAHDQWHAERKLRDEIQKLPEHAAA